MYVHYVLQRKDYDIISHVHITYSRYSMHLQVLRGYCHTAFIVVSAVVSEYYDDECMNTVSDRYQCIPNTVFCILHTGVIMPRVLLQKV